jgi:hypothetical protein
MSKKSSTSNLVIFQLFLFSVVFFMSCNQSNKQSEKVLTANDLTLIMQQKAWEESSDFVKKITMSPKGLIRGVDWGLSLNDLKETVELSEVQPSQGKSYTQYLDDSDLNFVDITYLQREGQSIHEISLDIFLENKEDVTELIKELSDFLNLKFGKSNVLGSKVIWSKYKNTQIQLEDVSTSKDLGIKVVFKKVP